MIYVITHRKFDDSFIEKKYYQVLHVGKNQDCNEDSLRDDTEENISEKNPFYCELTGLYWMWKNGKESNDDIVGLVHYRRYFTTRMGDLLYTYFNVKPNLLPYHKIQSNLKKYDVILPKRVRIFRTVYEYYNDEHIIEDMDITRSVILEKTPNYIAAFDKVMKQHYYYYANMMICKAETLKKYSEWLFNIMFHIEKKIDMNKYKNDYQRRVYGFISERLLQVWVLHNGLKIKEYPIYNTEKRRMTICDVNKNRFKKFIITIKKRRE